MRKIIKLPKKTPLDYERPVQELSDDDVESESEQDLEEEELREMRFLKKGKFYKNLKEEEKAQILSQIREDDEQVEHVWAEEGQFPTAIFSDSEMPAQGVTNDRSDSKSEEGSEEYGLQESRFLKKGKFYNNLSKEEKQEILSKIRADEDDQVKGGLSRENEAPKKVGRLILKMRRKERGNLSEPAEKLKVVEVPTDSGENKKREARKKEGRNKRLKKLRINKPRPKLYEILDNGEMLDDDVEDRWQEQRFVVPMGWFALLGIAICSVAIWAGYGVFRSETVPVEGDARKRAAVLAKEKDDRETRETLAAMQECVSSYLAAPNVEAMLPWVRHSEHVGPLMRDYYRKNKRWRSRFVRFEQIRPLSFGKRAFVYVKVFVEKGRPRHLFLEQVGDTRFLVDWESEVMYQPMVWGGYVKKRPLSPMNMRVRVQKDDFYTHAFRDRSRYQCYKLTSLGSGDYLFGYIERGSGLEEQIESLLMKLAGKRQDDEEFGDADGPDADEGEEDMIAGIDIDLSVESKPEALKEKPHAMILKLRFLSEDKSKRGVLIEALVSERWLNADPPQGP